MYQFRFIKVFPFWMLCGIVATLSACNGDPSTPTSPTAVPLLVEMTQTPTSSSPSVSPLETPTATATPPLPAGNDEPIVEPPSTNCPEETTVFPLQAMHNFWVNTPYGKWQWEANGTLPLIVDETGNAFNQAGIFVTGSQFGNFQSGENSCSFTAPASVAVSISGVCIDGLLILDISEDWQMGTYEWQCDEDAFQFEVPPMGSATHSDLEFPLAQSGSVLVEIPFAGGEGTKSWQLAIDEIETETVPLTP